MTSKSEDQKTLFLIEKLTGIDFSESEKFQIEKRIKEFEVLLRASDLTLSQYLDTYEIHKELTEALINLATNNETAFFRDKNPFELIGHLLENKLSDCKNIRFLSLPASTGQEAYSLLFTLLNSKVDSKYFQIDAKDIDTNALEKAKRGNYNRFEMMRGISDKDKERYFSTEGSGSVVKEDFRKLINFSQYNLLEDKLIKDHYDVIFLRNVLFYFKEDLRKEILSQVAGSLKRGGVIILGNGEKVITPNLKEESYNGLVYYSRS